jgi:hypothetical protein
MTSRNEKGENRLREEWDGPGLVNCDEVRGV